MLETRQINAASPPLIMQCMKTQAGSLSRSTLRWTFPQNQAVVAAANAVMVGRSDLMVVSDVATQKHTPNAEKQKKTLHLGVSAQIEVISFSVIHSIKVISVTFDLYSQTQIYRVKRFSSMLNNKFVLKKNSSQVQVSSNTRTDNRREYVVLYSAFVITTQQR
jgi:hypothetical protein